MAPVSQAARMPSKQFWVLMHRADEIALDEAIDCKALGAVWQSSGPGIWTPTDHESLVEALDAGVGLQAFLRGVGPKFPDGPVVQYYNGRGQDASNELRAGRMAYKFFPTSKGPSEADFQTLADAAFRAARSVTKPHVVTHDGKPVRGYRIGVHAREWYLEHPWPERVLRDMSTFATYRLKSESPQPPTC